MMRLLVLVIFFILALFVHHPATADDLGKRQFEAAANVSYRLPVNSVAQIYPGLHFPQTKLQKNFYLKPHMGLIVEAYAGDIKSYLKKIDEQAQIYYKIYNHFIEQIYTTDSGVKGAKYSYDHLGARKDVLRTNGYVIRTPQNLYLTLVCTYLATQQQLESACDHSAQTVRFHPE